MGDPRLDKLNTVVVKRYGSTGENAEPELALVVSSCDAPTFGLLDAEGNQFNWRQDLTRAANPDEAQAYWRRRTENAERLRDKALELVSKTQDQNSELIEKIIRY